MYEHIKDLRQDRDLKQRELAEYLNVSQNTYSQYENGIISLTAELLIKLARFYGTSVDYLLGLTNVKEPYPREQEKKQDFL
ncbi:helix-turn-helix transcriptional regulator [Ruminococcus sp. Marseille-P6503]|uniref:helix-turn-helix domain-containing protein n=1 Tax=Ruminococcus sp. Marseille-P6503 TaxID=2364796 RepID=UPI000F52EE90|nr:helix-turn-helix transcriptional regulator [Ruminococcus sp. Marseille-P6503]